MKCMSREGSPTGTKDVVLTDLLFSAAVWTSGWLGPYFGFPVHEGRAMPLCHSREDADG